MYLRSSNKTVILYWLGNVVQELTFIGFRLYQTLEMKGFRM